MNFLTLSGFVGVAITFILSFLFFAFYIMQRMVYSTQEYSFILLGIFLLGSSATALGQNMLYLSTASVPLSLFWEKFQHIGLFILYPVWLHFVFYYFYNIKWNWSIVFTYIFSLTSIILTLTSNLLFVQTPVWFKNFHSFTFGPLYSPFIAIIFISILYIFILMILDFKRNPNNRQYKLLLIIASGTTMLTGFKDLLETWVKTDIPQLFPYGIILTGITLFFSISLRYREMQKKIEKRKEIEKEAFLAQKIQKKFIPSKCQKETNFYEFTAFSQPALHLNGDFYYKIDLLPEKSFFIIGDITGHGIRSSIYMSLILSFLEIIKNTKVFHSLSTISDNINKVLFKHAYLDSIFATCFLCEINFTKQTISYINAGHPNGILVPGTNSDIIQLTHTNSPIGLNPNQIFKPQNISYQSQDKLFLYTDGIVEQINRKSQPFSFLNLKDHLTKTPFSTISEELLLNLTNFTQKPDFDDDITFMGILLK